MELLELLKTREIIIFGSGEFSKRVTKQLRIPVKYYVDNNFRKWGTTYLKKPVKSPSSLLSEPSDKIAIIVASSHFTQIAEQLIQLGFQENKHFYNGIDFLYFNDRKVVNWSSIKEKLKSLFQTKFFIKLYYFCKGSFDREMIGTFKGIQIQHLAEFRRDLHRIEKGLIMKDRRELFALDYIEKTVTTFGKLVTNYKEKHERTIKWGRDVLNEYFKTVRLTYQLTILKEKFVEYCNIYNQKNPQNFPELYIPYRRTNFQTKIKFDDFYELALYRRSVRYYREKKVPREIIDNAIKLALQSPSACNRQPFRFIVVDEPNLLQKVKELPVGIKNFEDSIPAIAIVIGDLSAFFYERDRHLIYIDSSLAAMSFIYALEIQGISSCILNWADIEEKEQEIQSLFSLKIYERPIMLIAFGYADENSLVAYSAKKDLDEVRSYNNG